MRYILVTLSLFVCATSAQAEWTWVCWERSIKITGQRAEINQRLAEKQDGWETVSVFQEKERCREYVIALSKSRGEDWEKTAKNLRYEILYLVSTELDNYGMEAGILSKTGGDQWNVLEWKCLPQKPRNVAVIGTGTLSCGKWLEGSRQGPAARAQLLQWVYGFLSGVNSHTAGPQAKPLDVEAGAAFVDAYCRNNPLHALVLAAAALVQETGGPKALHQWKR